MGGAGEGVVVLVDVVGVDLGLVPAENPEGVVQSEIDQREGNGAGPRFPCGGGGEELVSYKVVVVGGRGRVDAEPVESGGRVDAGPLD